MVYSCFGLSKLVGILSLN